MKKLLLFLSLLLLASPVFAAVGINVNGTTIGTAGNLYVNCNTGGSPYIDGFNYSATCSNSLVADGTYNGGYVSLGTTDSGIPLTEVLVKKNINGTTGTATDTLANGTPNQILTLESVGAVTATWTVTPTTSTGFSSIVFNGAPQIATFLYVNSSVGWVILSSDGSGTNTAPIINDAGGL